MKRREFITLLGGAAAAWPLAARAQQQRAMPVIGYLHAGSGQAIATSMAGVRKGLGEVGYIEGRNVTVEYRFADNDVARLPALAADLVRRRVNVIVTGGGTAPALAAKAATTRIPVVFNSGGDPVVAGIVTSLNRPSGNVTGAYFMNTELSAKRLGLLHELLPKARRFAVLLNPAGSPATESVVQELQSAASTIGRQLVILYASTSSEIDMAFSRLAQDRVDALLVNSGILFSNRRVQLASQSTYHHLPAIHSERLQVEAGGLMSYGANIADSVRQTGIYAGRILQGEKPADLPVMQPTKFEFVINLQTATVLALEIPPSLLALADEVIE